MRDWVETRTVEARRKGVATGRPATIQTIQPVGGKTTRDSDDGQAKFIREN